ncbi:MAG: hypothetical protein CR994_09095 [Maribacter sp.]|nr:MAG: hypothetical protein CR994_09095 [Maribacter sp.]
MAKNHTLSFFNSLMMTMTLLGVVLVGYSGYSQQPGFTIADFDLKGAVKSCLVITSYGKEAYDFDREGKLTKSVTRYNDTDYDVTYYKYRGGELVEKRFENYRDNIFDSSTSYANFYEIDTIPVRKVTEKIITYDKEFLDRYEYIYNANGILVKIIRTNNDGNDETLIEYTDYKGERTQTNSLNGTILKSVRKSTRTGRGKKKRKVVLTKDFLEGEPHSATEAIYDLEGKLIEETKFNQDLKKKQFVPIENISYEYDEKGMLIKSTSKKDKEVNVEEYIYQYDNGEEGNWIKKIITPQNSYISREIEYYEIAGEQSGGE